MSRETLSRPDRFYFVVLSFLVSPVSTFVTLPRTRTLDIQRCLRFRQSFDIVLRSYNSNDEEFSEEDIQNAFNALSQSKGPRVSNTVPRKEKPKSTLALQDESVPEAQQPAQELEDLKAAPIFGWAQLDDGAFLTKVAYLYGASFVFPSLPIATITYQLDREPLQALLAANVGSMAVTVIILIRLYVGWSYVGDRLAKDVGYYEESGWYDGFLSVKPKDVRARDELLYKFEVEPVLSRVTKVTALVGVGFLASCLAFKLAAPLDPYSQFDSGYLDSLRGDDVAATREAQQAGSRSNKPTYCDSRYYKAVAGGNGC